MRQIFESQQCVRDGEATVLELHLDWAVMAVQQVCGDWSLLCNISLVLYAAAGIYEAGDAGAYLRRPPFLRASSSFSTLCAR